MNKLELRKAIFEDLRRLSDEEVMEQSVAINRHLEEWLGGLNIFQRVLMVGAFYPFTKEPQILQTILDWAKKTKPLPSLWFPAFPEKGDEFVWRSLTQELFFRSESWEKSSFGFHQPVLNPKPYPSLPCNEKTISPNFEFLLIPGVAFTRDGRRLGRGKGHYDRALSRLKNPIKIGVCFENQLIEKIPTESQDISMDAVISPSGWHPQMPTLAHFE